MRYLAIIQARASSTRLPGKVLEDICGRTQLEWVVRRVSMSKRVDKVVVATTTRSDDDPVADVCAGIGVDVYRGSLEDVLDRFYQAAKPYRPECVVRVTGDCPCFDPALLDEAVSEMRAEADYLGMLSETFPDGLDLEIVRFGALERAWREARMASQREHVTQYIVRNPDRFVLQDFRCREGDLGGERWTVDEPEDLELVRAILGHFAAEGDDGFSYRDVASFLDEHPSLRLLNSGFARNEGLRKSLANDRVFEGTGGVRDDLLTRGI